MVIDNCSLIAIRSPWVFGSKGKRRSQLSLAPLAQRGGRRGCCHHGAPVEPVQLNRMRRCAGCPGGTAGRAPRSVSGQGTKTRQPCQFSRSVGSDSATPWTAAHQASLSITNLQSSLKLMSIESVMPSSHLKLCCVPKKKKKEAHKLENNTKLRQCEERSS